MVKQKESSSPDGVSGAEITQSKETELISDKNQMDPGENSEFSEKESDKSSTFKSGTCQGLSLSHLSDNSKLDVADEGKSVLKGKSVVSEDYGDHNLDKNRWVEKDLLQLSGISSKREVEDDQIHVMSRDKKPKLETLDLSLSLPNVSLSLSALNRVQFRNGDPSNSNNTQTTFSNNYSASLSYSYSHQFSHNPSCSMTRNSTENYEIWKCEEGTNGSVHSRFRPAGDGGVALVQGNRTNSDNNLSLFPSELVARPGIDTQSGDSIGTYNYTDGVSEVPSSSSPQNIIKPGSHMIIDEWSVKSTKKYDFDSVESLMRIKEVEARMFQKKADEARKDAEGYKWMMRVKTQKLDEEYGEKIGELCLSECEERKRRKVEEFKVLENAHIRYLKLKMRMQAEMAGLLQRMENTRELCV